MDSDDLDPAEELRRLAGRLVEAYAADPGNAALAREARFTLLAVAVPDGDPELDELARILSTPTYPDGSVYER